MKLGNILILISTFSVVSISFGYSPNRTAWRKVSQFNSQPKALIEVLMNDIEVQEIDDGVRNSKVKKSSDEDNVMSDNISFKSSPDNQTNFIMKLIPESKFRLNIPENIIINPSVKETNKNGPLNVILLLIDRLDEQNVETYSEYLRSFPIQELLKGCPEMSDKFNFAEGIVVCNCEDLLKSNMISLLSWAQHEKKMSTSALYEILEVNSQSLVNPQIRRIDRQVQKSWFLNDPKSTEHYQSEDNSQNKELWRVKDILAKLREAFFRTLLNNIGSGTSNDQQHVADFRQLATRTLEDLNRMANENGYVLVITATTDELPDALKLLQHYVESQNSLIIVTSTCPRDRNNVLPFFARGPGSKNLISGGLHSVYAIPNIVRVILDDYACRDLTNCERSRVHEEVTTATPQHIRPIIIYDESEIPRNRFSRNEQPISKVQEKVHENITVVSNTTAKNNTKLSTKEVPVNLDIKLRVGDKMVFNNSQEITSYSTLLVAEIIIIITNYALKF